MDKFFGIAQNGSSIRTEILAGITTFFTMSYIMFVNPSILESTGMNREGVFIATILATVVGTLIMGLVAKVPFAVAPGMGLNAFFAYTVCIGLGFAWQEALAMVFICGIINIIITVTKLRKAIIRAIPKSLQLAIAGGIGLFIAYIGLINAKIIDISGPVPALSHLGSNGPLLTLIGIGITIVLMILNVRGFLLIGIIATTLIGIPMGLTTIPRTFFNPAAFSGFAEISFAFFGDVGFASLFDNGRAMMAVIIIFAFSLTDTFDTIGTFIGTGRRSGIFDEADEKAMIESRGFKSKMDRALFADAAATSVGALLGTSNTTCYVESASGIAEGGRTGLTSVVTAALFLLCIPLVTLFSMTPEQATAPALIIVGILMAESFKGIQWDKIHESIPAFFTVTIMAFAYNISYGIAAGFIFYALVKICKKEAKDLHPVLIGSILLFLIYFILMART
jgi:AGZA family xanthine/uracil permease-like MFS transporter